VVAKWMQIVPWKVKSKNVLVLFIITEKKWKKIKENGNFNKKPDFNEIELIF